jgi:hypothetical protein
MREGHDLRKRRQALETELGGLRDQRERGFRANRDALSRQQFAVTRPDAAGTSEFVDDEAAADAGMNDLRRQIDLVGDELARTRQFGVTQHDAAGMAEFADDEVAADAAMEDLRRQIELIDHALARSANGGLRGAAQRVLWWLHR